MGLCGGVAKASIPRSNAPRSTKPKSLTLRDIDRNQLQRVRRRQRGNARCGEGWHGALDHIWVRTRFPKYVVLVRYVTTLLLAVL